MKGEEATPFTELAVSRKVQDLETRLGAQLLHRTTRKLGLTEAGNVYFEHSQRIARELLGHPGSGFELAGFQNFNHPGCASWGQEYPKFKYSIVMSKFRAARQRAPLETPSHL